MIISPLWARAIDDIYSGGKLLAEIPVIPEGSPASHPIDLEFNAVELGICKKAFDASLASGQLAPTEWIMDIVHTLGFAPKAAIEPK